MVTRIAGKRCVECGYVLAGSRLRCPVCRGSLEDAEFGPEGRVWAWTTVRISIGGRKPPYTLAYVDLADGPRVLVHLDLPDDGRQIVGSSIRLAGSTEKGDLRGELVT